MLTQLCQQIETTDPDFKLAIKVQATIKTDFQVRALTLKTYRQHINRNLKHRFMNTENTDISQDSWYSRLRSQKLMCWGIWKSENGVRQNFGHINVRKYPLIRLQSLPASVKMCVTFQCQCLQVRQLETINICHYHLASRIEHYLSLLDIL